MKKIKSANRKKTMHYNKAFTLIELLAIIVILTIIAVITVPIILNVIENAKKGAAQNSAYGYKDAINKYYLSKMVNDNNYQVSNDEYEIAVYKNDGLSVTGEEPSDGWVKIVNSKVTDFSFKIGDYVVTYDSSNDSIETIKNGTIALTPSMMAVQNAKNKASEYMDSLKTSKGNITGMINLPVEGVTSEDITSGWVALIEGETIGYSLQVGEYVVTLNDETQSAQKSTTIASNSSEEETIISYYSGIVATKASNYVSSLLSDTTIQGYKKNTGKKVSEISTPSAPTGIDGNSWVYFEYNQNATGNKISAPDYSLKFTEGGYTFVVDNVAGTVSDPIYNGSIITPQKKPVSFADDTWEEIKSNLNANRNIYQIGSEKEIEIDGTSYTVRLANTSSCPEGWTGSKTACGVVIEFIDTIIDTGNNNANGHIMNETDTNVGGWPASSMYSYLNTTIFNKLPNELKVSGMIIDTKTISSHGSGATNYTSPGDKLYLLSFVEVRGSNNDYDSVKLASDTVTDGTRQLEYYTINTSNSGRIKHTTSGTAQNWWLRAATPHNTSSFLYVHSSGTINIGTASNSHGVAPAFRILD